MGADLAIRRGRRKGPDDQKDPANGLNKQDEQKVGFQEEKNHRDGRCRQVAVRTKRLPDIDDHRFLAQELDHIIKGLHNRRADAGLKAGSHNPVEAVYKTPDQGGGNKARQDKSIGVRHNAPPTRRVSSTPAPRLIQVVSLSSPNMDER